MPYPPRATVPLTQRMDGLRPAPAPARPQLNQNALQEQYRSVRSHYGNRAHVIEQLSASSALPHDGWGIEWPAVGEEARRQHLLRQPCAAPSRASPFCHKERVGTPMFFLHEPHFDDAVTAEAATPSQPDSIAGRGNSGHRGCAIAGLFGPLPGAATTYGRATLLGQSAWNELRMDAVGHGKALMPPPAAPQGW